MTNLREAGNEFYRKGKIDEAEEKYKAALAIVEQFLLKYVDKCEIDWFLTNG